MRQRYGALRSPLPWHSLVLCGAFLCVGPPPRAATRSPIVEHALQVRLEPAAHHLRVNDRLHVPGALVGKDFSFLLNAELQVRSRSPGLRLEVVKRRVLASAVGMDRQDDDPEHPVRVNVYRVWGARAGRDLTLDLLYQGLINNPIRELGQAYARGFSQTPGIIEERGVYLAGSSYWVPEVQDALVTYRLATDLPAGWKSVSQGSRESQGARANPGSRADERATRPLTSPDRVREVWNVDTPAEQVHLVAAHFAEYERDAAAMKAYAFLRTPDDALAARYLTATAQYLEMYQDLLGPYPYTKFALVENFWETGYGMPSFTLLGEQIIRFPFILTSSYPHELLHNWWGNGVFVDFSGGNWCEGLTAYLADHLLAEQRGQGAEQRRDSLQRVTDYVTLQNDFPLTQFRSRYDGVTEAIGYDKTAMVWNMLRQRVGDAPFIQSLKRFYRDNLFRAASFDDIRKSFEAVTGQDLGPFFHQWVTQTGVPELHLDEATRSGNRVTVTLSQREPQPWFALDVPVAIYTASGVQLRSIAMSADQPTASGTFELSSPVTRIDVDPQFQLYRRLSPLETPPSLSKAFGAGQVLIVLPSEGAAASYAGLVKAWSRTGVDVIEDRNLPSLPHDRTVWIIGSTNRYAATVGHALGVYGAALDSGGLHLAGASYPADVRSIVAAVRNPEDPDNVIVYASAPTAAAADGLARKLPHYGKYSWLIFKGDAPDNEAKGAWPASPSPLVHEFEAQTTLAALPVRRALADLPPQFDAERLKATIEWLADPAREGRGIGTRGLEDSAVYVADAFRRIGLQPLHHGGSYFQDFTVLGPDGKAAAAHNVIGVLPGSNAAYAHQSVLISAHYDHLGFGWPDVHAGDQGKLHPGADDNASGVAVLLELARTLADSHPARSIIFAAFTAEEEGLLGSREFVRRTRAADEPWPLGSVIADLNLDTVGRLETGKLTVLGADSAREWPFIFNGITATTGIPITVVTKAVDASDHTAFVEAGVPAVQLFASTALDYHRPSDTAGKIDFGGLIKVATALEEATEYLSSRPDPLHFTGSAVAGPLPAPGSPVDAGHGGVRRAATGIVPDMTYEGVGVRAASIAAGSGAEKAGLQPGDRLLSIAGNRTPDLKALAEALQHLHPGEIAEIEFARDETTLKARLTLGER